jgi:hypothetical protein
LTLRQAVSGALPISPVSPEPYGCLILGRRTSLPSIAGIMGKISTEIPCAHETFLFRSILRDRWNGSAALIYTLNWEPRPDPGND